MPSTKKNKSGAAEVAAAPVLGTAQAVAVPRIDIMAGLEVGAPSLEPLPATFQGIDFSIRRHFSAEVVWEWTRLQHRDSAKLSVEEIDSASSRLLEIVIDEADHDKIAALRAKVEALDVHVARRLWMYIYLQAGLVDERGNPLAL
ncbi:hypothetical protein [Gordonia malaquae]|uniref:hypothetical protein n=1 Tax=Gordonia malaquae TaxID=410332 RepID=UPI00301889D4